MPYRERWQTYRRRRNLFFFLLLTLVGPCVLMTRYAISQGIGDSGLWEFLPAGWGAAALAVGAWTNVLVCPRCGKLFFWGPWPKRGFLQRRCAHCALPKFA